MTNPTRNESIIIVGGGVIGLACAHYLQEAGKMVKIIEEGSLAGACSSGNCGYICPSHVLPLTEPSAIWTAVKSLFNPKAAFRIRPSLRPAFWNWMLQFLLRCHHGQVLKGGRALQPLLESSAREYNSLLENTLSGCDWEKNGLLYVFKNSSELEQFAGIDRFITEQFGIAAQRIGGSDLPEMDPALKPGLAGAFHYPDDTSLRPDLLNARWIDHLQHRGVELIDQCSLTGLHPSGATIQSIETTRGTMEADQFVFATGAWSSRLAQFLECRIPVEPGKGYSVTMPRPPICPTYPMLFPEKKVGVSPFKEGYRLGSMMEFSGFDSTIPAHRIEQLRQSAEDFLVEPYTDPILEIWYGWRPMTWDSLPIIGQVPRMENGFLATGHNMLGLAMATGTGRLVAELVQGIDTHIDPEPYSPKRF